MNAVAFCALIPQAWAASGFREDDHVISNGQGVSSPSFWDGLNGENPAGLSYNQTFKLQAGMAGYGNDLDVLRPSGALLVGNGMLGAGIEYAQYNGGALNSGNAQINWGISGYWTTISTAVGLSGHHATGSSGGSYDLGALIDLSKRLRLGLMLPGFTNGLSVIAGGLTYGMTSSVDLVVDGAIAVSGTKGIRIKPGINVDADWLHLTFAYAPDMAGGTAATFLREGISAGVGTRLARFLLLSYEYQGLADHRLGLTLKLN